MFGVLVSYVYLGCVYTIIHQIFSGFYWTDNGSDPSRILGEREISIKLKIVCSSIQKTNIDNRSG